MTEVVVPTPEQVLNSRIGKQYAREAEVRVSASDTSHAGASRRSKELAGWLPGLGSADADLLSERGDLVARSRDLGRNHGIASGAWQTLVDNIVGTGLNLNATPDYRALGKSKEWAREFRREVEARWRPYANKTYADVTNTDNFHGLTALVARQWFENGEVFALPVWVEDVRTPFKTKVQLVEADRVSNPTSRFDSDKLRSGVEIDRYGKPVAYHIQKKHPGDALGLYGASFGQEWERIPAETPWGRRRVIHAFHRERVDQHRGKPILSAVLPQFKMFDHYGKTELQAAVVNAMVAGFVETPMDPSDVAAMLGGVDPQSRDDYLQHVNQQLVPMRGAAMIALPAGTKVNAVAPARPAAQFGNFMEVVARHIGAGLNLPYELLLKDWSKTNYSSARAALLEAWRFFRGRRALIVAMWCVPFFDLWFEEAVNQMLLPVTPDEYYANREAYTRANWIGPGRGWIDPVKEAQAAQIRIQSGLSTLQAECAEQGEDYEEVLEQQAEEKSLREELGLAPAVVDATQSQQEATPAEEEEEALVAA